MRWMPAVPCFALACLIATLSPSVQAAKRSPKHESKGPPPLVMPPPSPLAPPPTPPPAPPPANESTGLNIDADSRDVWATTHAMAQAVRDAYDRLHRTEAFHRLALPYLGDDSLMNQHPVGKVVAEMLAADLAKDAPFVLLDRPHLSESMSQNHLNDLYRLDNQSAVTFGRLLGAQTLITGIVEDGGDDKYLVHLRQLDMQTGRIILDSQAVLNRDALDAAAANVVMQRTTQDALWRSALFPGVGQWYLQDRPKAYAFGGVGAASLGTALGFYIAAAVARSQYLENKPSTVGDRRVANDRLLGGNVSLAVYAAVWLVNLFDIYLTPTPPPQIRIE